MSIEHTGEHRRVLVTWGSKRGGTAGIGRTIAAALEARGFAAVALSCEEVRDLSGYDAVIVGGALYANRWPANVRRFVRRHVKGLSRVPVWLFSSGPLDESAAEKNIPPPTEIAVLGERVGAIGHVTFGGRLEPDAKGFPASAMAKTTSGDFRNPARIRAWAESVADAIPTARPGAPVVHEARSLPRLLAYGVAGWVAWAAVLYALVPLLGETAAIVLRALAAPVLFGVVGYRYFRPRGAREALPTALTWTATLAILDAVVSLSVSGTLAPFASIAGTFVPYALVFLTTWGTGALMSTRPWPKPAPKAPATT